MFASARFASFRIPSRPPLLRFAFSPPSNQGPRPIFPHRAVKQKFHGATVKRSSWSQSGCSFCRSELSLGRSVGRSTAISAPANQIFPVDPVFLSSSSSHPSRFLRLPFFRSNLPSNPLRSKLSRGYDIFRNILYIYISRFSILDG